MEETISPEARVDGLLAKLNMHVKKITHKDNKEALSDVEEVLRQLKEQPAELYRRKMSSALDSSARAYLAQERYISLGDSGFEITARIKATA